MVHSLLFTFKRALRRIAIGVIAGTMLLGSAPGCVHLAVMSKQDAGVVP